MGQQEIRQLHQVTIGVIDESLARVAHGHSPNPFGAGPRPSGQVRFSMESTISAFPALAASDLTVLAGRWPIMAEIVVSHSLQPERVNAILLA